MTRGRRYRWLLWEAGLWYAWRAEEYSEPLDVGAFRLKVYRYAPGHWEAYVWHRGQLCRVRDRAGKPLVAKNLQAAQHAAEAAGRKGGGRG